jgi:hypothetical protein
MTTSKSIVAIAVVVTCAPQFSRDVFLCDCGFGKCFNRNQSACVVR